MTKAQLSLGLMLEAMFLAVTEEEAHASPDGLVWEIEMMKELVDTNPLRIYLWYDLLWDLGL